MSNSNPKNRREFLSAGLPSHHTASHQPAQDSQIELNSAGLGGHKSAYLESYKKNAMACEFELLFNMHQYKNSAAAALEALKSIDALEDQLTVYRTTSELTYLNDHASDETVVVESGLYNLLELANQLHRDTEGAFDITSWPLSELWGFSRRNGSVPAQSEIEKAIELVSGDDVKLLPNYSVQFAKPGIKINLGGIGKGFALDKVANQVVASGVKDFVIHGGQSSVVARGENLKGATGDPWTVGLSDPISAGRRLLEIKLRNAALGTSGTGRQGFFHRGKRYGHIIDPRNGWPTDHFLSTTVICKSAAMADALATAFFVMKLEEIEAYCKRDEAIKAIVVLNKKRQQAPSVELFNFDSEELTVLE